MSGWLDTLAPEAEEAPPTPAELLADIRAVVNAVAAAIDASTAPSKPQGAQGTAEMAQQYQAVQAAFQDGDALRLRTHLELWQVAAWTALKASAPCADGPADDG